MKSKLLLVTVVMVSLIFAGCAKPPQVEIGTANSAMETLRAAEAETYAPQALKMAMDTLNAANAAKTEADGKFVLFRSYEKSKALYVSAEALAKSATEAAAAEKEKMRVQVNGMLEQAMMQLAVADTALMKAPVGKGNKADIEMIKADLANIRGSLDSVPADITAEKFTMARTKLQSIMERTSRIQDEIGKASAKKK
jgi:hypothetical protein